MVSLYVATNCMRRSRLCDPPIPDWNMVLRFFSWTFYFYFTLLAVCLFERSEINYKLYYKKKNKKTGALRTIQPAPVEVEKVFGACALAGFLNRRIVLSKKCVAEVNIKSP